MSADDSGPDPVLGDGPVTIDRDGVIHQGTPSGPAREGSRETYEGKIVSVPKDYCATPQGSSMKIVGYKIWAWQREATNLADTVLQTSLRSHVKGSIIKHCYGDEKGTLGGVCSGTHNGECTPKTWSETVTFQGRNAVRHHDEWWMNNGNTWGVLNYQKDMNQYPTDDPQKVDAKMWLAQAPGTMALPQAGTPSQSSAPPTASQSLQSFGKNSIGLNPFNMELNMIQQLPQQMQDSAGRLNSAISADQQRYLDQQVQKEGYKNWDDFVTQMKSLAKSQGKTQSNAVRQTGVRRLKCYNLNQFLKNKPADKKDYYVKEYCKQMKAQEKRINEMTVDQFNKEQQAFQTNGRLNDQGDYKPQLMQGYIDQLQSEGMSLSDARTAAQNAAPLHVPDQAWGNSVVDSLGDPNVNMSLGGGAPSRIAQLKKMLSDSKASKNDKLNVKLCAELDGKEVCGESPDA